RLTWNPAAFLVCDVLRQLNVLHQAASCFRRYDIRDTAIHVYLCNALLIRLLGCRRIFSNLMSIYYCIGDETQNWIKKSFSCNTLPVPSCHSTRRKHEGWDTARLPKPRQEKSRGRGRVRTTDLRFKGALVQLNVRFSANRTGDCVYKIKCDDCTKVHMGRAVRTLLTKIAQHTQARNADKYRALLKDLAMAEQVLARDTKV
ncbi:hypothetical protein T265_14750, partial [Opisthorchis viverrini]